VQIPTSLTRSTTTILVPGIVALTPWVLALVQHTSATLGFKDYPTIAHTIFLAAVIVVGTLCEGLGTFLEASWDKGRESEFQVQENWYAYLARCVDREPVGYRYLSRLVTAMYFELSMLFAVPSFVVGCAYLAYRRFPDNAPLWVAVGSIGVGVSVAFFGWQARATHGVICATRRELVQRMPAA